MDHLTGEIVALQTHFGIVETDDGAQFIMDGSEAVPAGLRIGDKVQFIGTVTSEQRIARNVSAAYTPTAQRLLQREQGFLQHMPPQPGSRAALTQAKATAASARVANASAAAAELVAKDAITWWGVAKAAIAAARAEANELMTVAKVAEVEAERIEKVALQGEDPVRATALEATAAKVRLWEAEVAIDRMVQQAAQSGAAEKTLAMKSAMAAITSKVASMMSSFSGGSCMGAVDVQDLMTVQPSQAIPTPLPPSPTGKRPDWEAMRRAMHRGVAEASQQAAAADVAQVALDAARSAAQRGAPPGEVANAAVEAATEKAAEAVSVAVAAINEVNRVVQLLGTEAALSRETIVASLRAEAEQADALHEEAENTIKTTSGEWQVAHHNEVSSGSSAGSSVAGSSTLDGSQGSRANRPPLAPDNTAIDARGMSQAQEAMPQML